MKAFGIKGKGWIPFKYFNNLNAIDIIYGEEFCYIKDEGFFYIMEQRNWRSELLKDGNWKQMIRYENYGNHIHFDWRTTNEFGKELIK
jgi:hypothetical protein